MKKQKRLKLRFNQLYTWLTNIIDVNHQRGGHSRIVRLVLSLVLSLAITLALPQAFHQTAVAQTCPPQYAGCSGGCTRNGQCIGNKVCTVDGNNYLVITNRACGSTIMGKITPPQGVIDYNIDSAQYGGRIGIVLFASRLLRIATILAGIWVMANFILAGIDFITNAGNTETMGKVKDRLTYSLIGIILVVSAYTVAGIIGLVFFGDAGFILNPDLETLGALSP